MLILIQAKPFNEYVKHLGFTLIPWGPALVETYD